MIKRNIFFGKPVKSLKDPIDLTIHTKCPEKWILIDLETLQVYRGQEYPNKYGKWKRIFNPNLRWYNR